MLGYVQHILGKSPPLSDTLHDAVSAFEDPLGKTTTFLNYHWENNNQEELRTMLTDGLSGRQFQTPLMLAIGRNRPDIVEVLLTYYRLLHINCTLGLVDSAGGIDDDIPGNNAIDYAIANYQENNDDKAWRIIEMVVAREHEVCTPEDGVELPRIRRDLADILAQRNTDFEALVGWVDVAHNPSSAFQPRPFISALESVLYDLEELVLSKSKLDKQVLVQTLLRKLHALPAADKSAVVWLNEELVDLRHSLM